MNREVLTADHIKNFDMRQHELDVLPSNQLEVVLRSCRADALLDQGEVVAILGFFPMWEGVAEVFVIPSKRTADRAIMYFSAVRTALDQMIAEEKFRRVQSTARSDEVTDRWMGLLGFHIEGVLEKYARNGEDYKLWARLS